MVAANILISHCSGVTVFYHEADYFSLKVIYLHRPNAISFQMMLGGSVVACRGVLHFPGRILDNTVCLCGLHPEPLMGVTAGGQKLQRGTVITRGYFLGRRDYDNPHHCSY